MKKIFATLSAIIVGFSTFTLAGCADNEKYIGVEGVVVEKEFVPEHTTSQFIWCGKFGYTAYYHHDDAWYLTIEYEVKSTAAPNAPIVTDQVKYEVTEETYNTYEIGDVYIYTEDEDD